MVSMEQNKIRGARSSLFICKNCNKSSLIVNARYHNHKQICASCDFSMEVKRKIRYLDRIKRIRDYLETRRSRKLNDN